MTYKELLKCIVMGAGVGLGASLVFTIVIMLVV